MSNFESLLGRRYLQRTHKRPRIFWIGLVGLVLGVVAMLASSALKKHAESIAKEIGVDKLKGLTTPCTKVDVPRGKFVEAAKPMDPMKPT